MNEANASRGEMTFRRQHRPPVEYEESALEDDADDQDLDEAAMDSDTEVDPDGALNQDLSSDEPSAARGDDASEQPGATSLRFEDIKVGLRKRSAERCIIGVDIDLILDARTADSESDDEDERSEPRAQEYSLDSGEVESMLAAPTPRRMAPMAMPAGRAGSAIHGTAAPQARPPSKWNFDRKKFFQGYTAAFSKLDRRQTEGLNALLTAAEADTKLTDIRWLAYMLATVKLECGDKWRPIEEYGKGANQPYGRPVVVTDPEGKKYRNAYYGRGYVQLTWKRNYDEMGKRLKNRLLYNPALALHPSVAYRIMSIGMRGGLFTGKSLGDYIHGSKADYVRARKIINTLNQATLPLAQKMARNAIKLEKLLRRSAAPAPRTPPR